MKEKSQILQKILFSNYFCFNDIEFKFLNPITVIFGPAATGKTTLLNGIFFLFNHIFNQKGIGIQRSNKDPFPIIEYHFDPKILLSKGPESLDQETKKIILNNSSIIVRIQDHKVQLRPDKLSKDLFFEILKRSINVLYWNERSSLENKWGFSLSELLLAKSYSIHP